MARGDHLYYFMAGGTYSHHGLDCGDGTIVHYDLTPWEKISGKLNPETCNARVVRTTLEDFSRGNEVHVRNYENSGEIELVIERAMSKIGEDGYSVFGNNCEHFVVWCKTGEAQSSQVDAHKKAAATVIFGAPVGLMLLRAARRVPGPYRGYATLGAIGLAGVAYVVTYVRKRIQQVHAGVS